MIILHVLHISATVLFFPTLSSVSRLHVQRKQDPEMENPGEVNYVAVVQQDKCRHVPTVPSLWLL